MGLGGILVLLALLVSLIVFIYIIVVTARSWGILHTLLLCTLFIESWVFMFFTAGVHYERVTATESAHKAQIAAERAESETTRLLYGDFSMSPEAQDAVIPLKGELLRLTADRGRVWRRVSLLQVGTADYQLELMSSAPAEAVDEFGEPAAAAAPQINSDSLPQGLVVYAFSETISEEDVAIPDFFLGEFTVSQSQAGQVTLEPTRELMSDQAQRISEGRATSWSLYELLPLDSHVAFAAPGSQPTEEAVFGRIDEETLTGLFDAIPEENNRREKIASQYLLDGKRAPDNAPPESVWVQVNLLKDFELQVDSADSANLTERGYFDSTGRSIDTRIKRGEEGPVTLNPEGTRGKLIVLQEAAARPLIASGVAEEVQRIYVRPLVDYEEAFSNYSIMKRKLSDSISVIQRETADINQANQLGREMVIFSQAENQKLAFDLEHTQQEVTVVTQLVEQATQQLQALRTEVSKLYREVQAKRKQLVAQQLSMLTATP
ncbi:hypothetical protein [Aureliella helgolandensis]|uniref:Uncharacterized protein n=1 Tax=Aureliella helgolandensis TaxID=2527968 RepID=A0A518G7Z6_9BACT|nr:hypothetical protein [Aureliella helgolandensis]QDV24711.1 hypothetical protein Q31a_30320 [Aureliella helgolandensis]